MEFFNNHKKLFGAAAALFIVLTLFVCVMPAVNNQENNAPLPNAVPLSEEAILGKGVFIANGCVACHTQQVRIVDMDKMWGSRPSIAADYADIHRTDFWRNTATLMGTERTGPDLTNIGVRQPGKEWHLPHLFNPRILVKESIMPAYLWMFTIKPKAEMGDVVVPVPDEFMRGKKGVVVANAEAMQLVAYLQSLKQTKLPDGTPEPLFLYGKKIDVNAAAGTSTAGGEPKFDGALLYTSNCQACHQANGEGLKGAFPPLKGSKIVLDANPELFVDIIMNGYNGRASEGYGVMPAVAKMNNLNADQITAIMNHERTSWGNNAEKVTVDQIKKIIADLKAAPKK